MAASRPTQCPEAHVRRRGPASEGILSDNDRPSRIKSVLSAVKSSEQQLSVTSTLFIVAVPAVINWQMATWQLRWIKPPPMICTCCEQPSLMEAANALLYTPSVCPSVCPVTVPFTKRADTPLCRRAVQLARSQQQLFLFRRDLCVILFGVLAVF